MRDRIYCHGCKSNLLYLSAVTDPDNPNFDQPCCPHCGSNQVQESEEADD